MAGDRREDGHGGWGPISQLKARDAVRLRLVHARRVALEACRSGGRGDHIPLRPPEPTLPVTIDRGALRAILLLAAEGAKSSSAHLTPRTSEAWSILASSATGNGPAIIRIGSPSVEIPGGWMTAAAAARVMRCSDRHVRELARRGAVLARRHGKVWMIDRASAENWRRAA